MILYRRPDGGLVFEVNWQQFVTDWRTAVPSQRVVLDDGRPAVRQEPDPDDTGHGEVTYTTLAPALWDLIKRRQQEAFRMAPPLPRTRLCAACRGTMRVSREYENVWTFKCEQCSSSETWGKEHIGGTFGAGEKEKQ